MTSGINQYIIDDDFDILEEVAKAYEQGKRDAEPHWIPCSEQKPQPRCIEYLADGSFPRIRLCRCGFYTLNTEEHGRFYVDAEIVSMFESAMEKGRATRRNGKRNFIESLYQNRIIAWMPLPEPYGGESE